MEIAYQDRVMKRASLLLAFFLPSLLFGRSIIVLTESSVPYEIDCVNAIGMHFEFGGDQSREFPIDPKITPTHCWVKKEGPGSVTIQFRFGQLESDLGPNTVELTRFKVEEDFRFRYEEVAGLKTPE